MNATILVVDDNADALEAMTDLLEAAGYGVLTANSGEVARETLERRGSELDVMVTDVLMPRTDGLELLAWVRTINPRLKVVVVSGGGVHYDASTCLRYAEKMGADRIIHKDTLEDTLVKELSALLSSD